MAEPMKIGKHDLKKERHIVSWTQQEDDVLREQISLHGTENWSIIASKFKDKTTRQCRRRWYTYLNSDFKKGGWSRDEDILLCEAQKLFGNRWTEIAKVVSGRTDNAVKNRFSTLCKKRAKYVELEKENDTSIINLKNKRVNTDGLSEDKLQMERIISGIDNCKFEERLNKKLRTPPTELNRNIHNSVHFSAQQSVSKAKEIFNEARAKTDRETFMKKDDPKKFALFQQAELLSSLAVQVHAENTKQSLEYAWKVLQEFLNQNKENKITGHNFHDIDLQSDDIKDLIEDLRSSNYGDQLRRPELHESPASSEYSTGSTLQLLRACNKTNQSENQDCRKSKDETLNRSVVNPGENLQCVHEITNDLVTSALSNIDFDSPILLTPQFKSLGMRIQSPQFSESERKFLLKTLGMESPSPNPSANSSKPPACKRAILQAIVV